jgi:hypothetical protein|tara:strand:- start:3668 stop:3988 length:321 start_codon:yes stop_codon:yes gene_type:complete
MVEQLSKEKMAKLTAEMRKEPTEDLEAAVEVLGMVALVECHKALFEALKDALDMPSEMTIRNFEGLFNGIIDQDPEDIMLEASPTYAVMCLELSRRRREATQEEDA